MTRSTAVAILLTVAAAALPAHGGGQCPPPPNPSGCPLAVPRTLLQERDVDMDGQPDNEGSTGNFCGGGSPASCGPLGAEVALQLFVENPANQSVTCSIPGGFDIEVWIMPSGCGGCLATGVGSATLVAGTSTAQNYDVVVSDVNAEVCPCSGLLTCTFSTEAVCDDGADGDGDGLVDAADPDCCLDNDDDGFCGAADCDDANPVIHDVPVHSELSAASAPSATELSWTSARGSVADIVSGSLTDVISLGDFSLAACLADDEQGSIYADTRADPAPGAVDYYLLRQQNACAAGSYAVPSQERAGLDASGPCAYDPACPSCEFCTLDDPEPVCGAGQLCEPTYGFPEVECTAGGSGTQGSSCAGGVSECAPGFTCIDYQGSPTCLAWCDTPSLPCLAIGFCAPFDPPVIVEGTEWGVCVTF